MKALHVGTYAGIPVKIHWTFAFMLLWILYTAHQNGLDPISIVWFTGFVLMLFVCVVFHEYGHALTAKRFGVKTYDILISPIGGLARLARIPRRPWHEFLVAIAGPAVNLLIAIVVILGLTPIVGFEEIVQPLQHISDVATPLGFMKALWQTNIALLVFNLVPAFPMDGGRILRALLAIKLSRVTATNIAAGVGQLLAVGFVILAVIDGMVTWGLIGLFVFIMARNERNSVKLEHKLETTTVEHLMSTQWPSISPTDTIADSLETNPTMRDTLVIHEGAVAGILATEHIRVAVRDDQLQSKIEEHITYNYAPIRPETTIAMAFTLMNTKGLSLLVIKNGDQILGVLDRHLLQQAISSY